MTQVLRASALAFCAALAAVAAPGAAQAGCTEPSEASAVKKSVRQAMRCDYKALRSGADPGCTVTPPPACADTLVADANDLAYGAAALDEVDTRVLRDQLKCQKRIGKAVSHYVGIKLRYLTQGKSEAEAEAKAIKHLDKLVDFCAVPVAQDTATGIVLPRVGPQCAAAIGAVGGAVDLTALRGCLRQLGEVWVARNGPDPQPLRPNILFILSDDQRWDTTDDTHSPVPGQNIMPGLRSELGGSGVEFTEAFMTTPLCCPSRSSILRGQYAHTTGVYTNSGVKGGADDFVDTVSIGTILQSAGYRTGFFGKYMNGYNGLWPDMNTPYIPPGWTVWSGFRQPKYFDYDLVENGVPVAYGSADADYSTDVLRERTKQFITDSVTLGQPFFVHLSVKAPHGPFDPAPRHDGMFAALPPWRPASYNEPDVSDKPTWVQNTNQLTPTEQATLDNKRIKQLEMLQAVDEAIGGSTTYGITGLMQHLRNLGVADDTLVVYFADNGWHWGEHRYEAKNKPYEESIRSPMFVRYPKLAPLPRVEGEMALNIDLCPTFAELALRPTDPAPGLVFDGVSLVRRLDGTAPTWRSDFLTEGWPANHVWASVREHDWKYTELPTDPGNPMTGFEFELYDLVSDPLELNNLATDPGQTLRIDAMAARLRVLRPLWPFDADPLFEDMDE
ncbi:MAG: sulfatase family protein [Candidatus Binatia bacterium]